MLLSPIQNGAVLTEGVWEQVRPVITQIFGVDFQIGGKWVYKSMGMDGHNGLDFRAPIGTPVFAAHDGIVTHIKKDKGGYGWHIRLRSEFNPKETIYAHLSEFLVEVGQSVGMGDKIGLSGNTGLSTAPHLHFGWRRLKPSADKDLKNWAVDDYDNGYFGWIDPIEVLITWKGNLINHSL